MSNMDDSPRQHGNGGGFTKLLSRSLSAKRQRNKDDKRRSRSRNNGEDLLDPDSTRGRRSTAKNRGTTDDGASVYEEDSDSRSFGSTGSNLSQERGTSL